MPSKIQQFFNRLLQPNLAKIQDTRAICGIITDVAVYPKDEDFVCCLVENPVDGKFQHIYLEKHFDINKRIEEFIRCNYAMVHKLEKFYGDKISSKAFKMAYQFEQDVKARTISVFFPVMD